MVLLAVSVMACSADEAAAEKKIVADIVKLDVFKSPTCECCGRWVTHVDSLGFKGTTHHPTDLNGVKVELGIAPQYQSCHTGVSKEGYVFEGHIPAKIMQRFLSEKPEGALGLAVPGMPMGSPGMEMGNRYDNYDVLLLKKDGTSQVYERIRPKG
ncbi:MAG: metal-binding protein [Cycloclasticus sp. symbiont of Bathymodiolus heckerae]|nr:MAG: metal-binding protein [Cycloclasticus sp. symbiont of Bathymodiolus heckerae]